MRKSIREKAQSAETKKQQKQGATPESKLLLWLINWRHVNLFGEGVSAFSIEVSTIFYDSSWLSAFSHWEGDDSTVRVDIDLCDQEDHFVIE